MEKQLERQEQKGSHFIAIDRLTIADIANHGVSFSVRVH